MGSKFLLWKISSKRYYELSWHICIILYPIQFITKLFVYWGVIFYVILLCIATPNVNNLKQNESDFCTIQGFCTSKMILSAYMYRKEYSGFLRKVGKLPRYLNEILHQFGANTIVLMSLMFSDSVKRANCRWKQIFRYFIIILHIGIACTIDTMIFRYNYVPSATTKPMTNGLNKSHKMSHANCNQYLP